MPNLKTAAAVMLSRSAMYRIFPSAIWTFIKYGRDGVHVNGPASFGEIHDLKGLDMGDDMIAINAWDWDVSAITYGTVEYI